MAQRPIGDGEILLALRESGESCDVLAAGDQPARKVAGVAAEVIGRHFDAALANWSGPHEIDRKAPQMGKARLGGGALDRPADQRRGRTGVLMVGMPWAAGEGARAKDAFRDFAVGCVQWKPPALSPARELCAMMRLEARWFVSKLLSPTCL